jgi:hypothetical protein
MIQEAHYDIVLRPATKGFFHRGTFDAEENTMSESRCISYIKLWPSQFDIEGEADRCRFSELMETCGRQSVCDRGERPRRARRCFLCLIALGRQLGSNVLQPPIRHPFAARGRVEVDDESLILDEQIITIVNVLRRFF